MSAELRHHTAWCVDCENVNNEWESHNGARRTVILNGGGLPVRNAPDQDALDVYAYRNDDGPAVIELGTDESTSGCAGSMWLTVDEARRYAEAILSVVEEVGR